MAKPFSLVSWNVEHFRGGQPRVAGVVAFLKKQKPDVLALYEVEGKDVFGQLTAQMPGYAFHITEGPQTQEILVGVRSNLSAFFTQRLEFKSGNALLRPGALLTVTIAGKHCTLLFLHTKSGNLPIGMGIRDDMLVRACKFRRVLDKAANGQANYMFLGDLNAMGLKYPFGHNIDAPIELRKLEREAGRVNMLRLAKTAPATWSNGSSSSIPPSDLDQVVAAEHLRFKSWNGSPVDVRGWPKLSTSAADSWIKRYSDHALLYLEVQRV